MRRYIVCRAWDHIDWDNEVVECRFVYDHRANELIHVDVRHGSKWRCASRDEWADIEDSVMHANGNRLDEPDEEFVAKSSLPSWARDKAPRAVKSRPRVAVEATEFQLRFDGI